MTHAIAAALITAASLGLSTAAQLQAEEKKAAAESVAGTAPTQIMIEAKFVEIGGAAKAKSSVLNAIFGNGPAPKEAAGALGVAGVFTEPQFAAVMKELNALKGVDLLSAPRVTTRSGQKATIEIVREFRYPTEYEKDGPAWKEKDFATRNVGVTFGVLATAKADGTLDLAMRPSVVEFLGFIDLDKGTKYPANAKPNASVTDLDATAGVPAGHRAQPVFSERKITSTVTVLPGQTVVVSNLGDTGESKDFPRKGPARKLAVFVTASLVKETPPAATEAPKPEPASAAPAVEARNPSKPTAAADPVASVIIPRLEFREATLSEAVEFLVQKGRASGVSPVNIVVVKPPTSEPSITVSLTNIPLTEAIRYVAELSGLKVRREANAFVLEPAVAKGAANASTSPAWQKAEAIIIPHVEFNRAPLADALAYLRKRAVELDPDPNPAQRGVNIVSMPPAPGASEATVTLNLEKAPLSEILRYVASLTNLHLEAQASALVLRRKSADESAK